MRAFGSVIGQRPFARDFPRSDSVDVSHARIDTAAADRRPPTPRPGNEGPREISEGGREEGRREEGGRLGWIIIQHCIIAAEQGARTQGAGTKANQDQRAFASTRRKRGGN